MRKKTKKEIESEDGTKVTQIYWPGVEAAGKEEFDVLAAEMGISQSEFGRWCFYKLFRGRPRVQGLAAIFLPAWDAKGEKRSR